MTEMKFLSERKCLLLAQCKYQIYVYVEVVSQETWPEGLFKENYVNMFSREVVNNMQHILH